ncbi:Glycoside hydrolase [Macleaya cordata]|uniref:Glycoside hydrolase n=1 Tax=Macleaya cordata TaxID=56857 RepID=A0A200R4B8_MACCD|nr:Glycoside hydrolase [Macleaya cordata]
MATLLQVVSLTKSPSAALSPYHQYSKTSSSSSTTTTTKRNNIINNNGSFLSGGVVIRNIGNESLSSSPNHYNDRRSSPSIRCLFGKVIAPAIDDVADVLNGVTGLIPVSQPDRVKRSDFPTDFKFGASTSALQTEGSGSEGGRGPSTWDSFLQDSSVAGTEQGTDSYHKYKEDVKLLKDMGMNAYRMSISWSRLLPTGKLSGGINQDGIDFYNNFFQELLDNGIEPFVTLFHFDLPTALQTEYRGFLNKQIVDDFKDFADLCYKNFGDKVKHWTTINEPQLFANYGYRVGLKPKGDNVNDPYDAAHNIILCHAAAAKLYKQNYQATQGGEIGISIVGQWFISHSTSPLDKEAADRANAFMVGWFMEPLVYGDYPFIMRALVRDNLPTFTDEEKEMVKGSYDFIGVNYYTSRYAKDIPLTPDYQYNTSDAYQHVQQEVEKNGVPIGPLPPGGSNSIYIYPTGLRDVLIYLKNRYQNPKFFVTENGVPEGRDDSVPLEQALKDDHRIEVINSHLYAVREAMKKGVNMKGFFIWALLDCMEMGSAYNVRFGLNYVDYNDNLKRYPKKSAKWIHSFLKKKH